MNKWKQMQDEAKKMLDELLDVESGLWKGTIKFLESLQRQREQGRVFSTDQINILRSIWNETLG